ncbi:outer membrane lipoprotein chaperone LolA [Methylococcus sp. EFPC2]|uniref:outer membrane lipoprotein chaperone LolA n=1 Tax=Methylococcus sp. EFPC2 TaxID=2812648 RepID=UPI00196736A9|nr:outer membrane lipoprotein chaperone LolA [Methylococcus sp. EFPC2]QSA97457.1 outer membrane lipoprotein chaperone LolA [Methylococcus sp. EFPC2]
MFKFAARLLLLWGVMNPSFADDEGVRHLRAFLGKAGTLKADFSQVMVSEKGEPGRKSSGVFYLQRPGKFRWDYRTPYKQEIVASGGKVWFYDVDLEQVTAKKLNQAIGSTPALLLTGEVALEKNFVIDSQGLEDGLYWLKLVPKDEDSGFKYVLIGLNGDNLAGMELSDNFGQLTRIYFSNVQTGARLEPGLFEFVPPKGVDVFEEK